MRTTVEALIERKENSVFNLDSEMKTDRIIDYIAELKERQEQLEEVVSDMSERIVTLEEQVLVLTSGQKDN